jgi:nucleoside phosphorylase
MKATRNTLSHEDYTVGWISALPLEMAIAKEMLDVVHDQLPQDVNDYNTYTLGSVHGHNVAIACPPSAVYGTTSAAVVATQMLSTFRAIRFGLMVGIGGGVPSKEADIRLGDIVVSEPTDTFGGVIQYDYGKTVNGGSFQQTGVLGKPPQVLLTAVSDLQADKMMGISQIPMLLSQLEAKYPAASQFTYPGQEYDQLYEAEYDHVGSGNTCRDCNKDNLVVRPSRVSSNPQVYYGLIASGNQVMKHGGTRDRLARELDILCFEMEAAGLIGGFPCLVIRGICDYSDSHKNRQWQEYAAATAAAYAKELLSGISTRHIWRTATANDTWSIALAGVDASIVTFLDISNKILARLPESHSTTKELPAFFTHVAVQLPLIIDVMKRVKRDCGDGSLSADALLHIVNDCLEQITTLDKLIQKILPTSTDSRLLRVMKTIASIGKEKIVMAILKTLEEQKSALILHFCQRPGAAMVRMHKPGEMNTGKNREFTILLLWLTDSKVWQPCNGKT